MSNFAMVSVFSHLLWNYFLENFKRKLRKFSLESESSLFLICQMSLWGTCNYIFLLIHLRIQFFFSLRLWNCYLSYVYGSCGLPVLFQLVRWVSFAKCFLIFIKVLLFQLRKAGKRGMCQLVYCPEILIT